MPDRAAIDATIDHYLASFTANDADGWLSCWAADPWAEDPVGTPRKTGRDELRVFFEESHAVAESVELRAAGIRIVIGNEAVFTMHALPVIGGTTYTLDIIDHMTFDDDGKITSLRAFHDPSTVRPAD
jgi:steroid delta-isomerase